MRERPILFSAPMVRAILDGRKTQTRRIVKPCKDRGIGCELAPHEIAGEVNGGDYRNSRYTPGDRLWVRETWAGPLVDSDTFEASGGDKAKFKKPEFCRYAADGGPRPEFMDADDNLRQCWTPAIHMFRWASRITLELSAVRVERLQDISEADAIAEGIVETHGGYGLPDGSHFHCTDPRICYWSLWDAINPALPTQANPWIWAAAFRRITP